MLVPLYGFVAGDTLGVLVLVDDHDTIEKVARTLAAATSVRVRPRANLRLVVRGRVLDPRATLEASGVSALDRVDIFVRA